MMSSRQRFQYALGKGAAIAALLPMAANFVFIIHARAPDGVNSPYGYDADIVLLSLFSILALLATVVLLGISKILIKEVASTTVTLIKGMIAITLIQLVAIAISAHQIQKCGYVIC